MKTKKEKFEIYPISRWSVTNYGVPLYVNISPVPRFSDGVSLDVEDDERDGFVGIGIYDGRACYWWSDWELAKQLTIPRFIAHNGRTDLAKLQKWGFKVDQSFLLWDTQLMAHILDSSRKAYGLKKLVVDLGINYPTYEDICGKKENKSHRTLKDVEPELVAEYNAMDCYVTYKLYEQQTKGQGATTSTLETPAVHYFETLEKPISFIFQKMEDRGITVDLDYLLDLKDQLQEQKNPLILAIRNELGDINLNSPKQLLGALNAKGIHPELKGKASTDKRALDRFRDDPRVSNLLRYSEIETLLSSFVTPYLERGETVGQLDRFIVHPSFHQTGTRTGRPSCSNPNLLQIPRRTENGKKVRRMFRAREGCLLGDCDFGQIEPRVLAHLSKDPDLCGMFQQGVDFHSFTAERLHISREEAKILNLSVGYRATFKSVSQQLKCSFHKAQEEINAWWSLFPGLWDWQQQLIYQAKKDGYITTLLGRRIKVEDLDNGNQWRREGAERQLINNITQGSAAEIMKKAMILVDKANIDILVQVYDELLIEECEDGIQEALMKTVDLMEHCVELEVPLTVDAGIGENWNEAKS